MPRIVRANNSCEHSHSRECEYSGQNYYANVRANSSRECETALRRQLFEMTIGGEICTLVSFPLSPPFLLPLLSFPLYLLLSLSAHVHLSIAPPFQSFPNFPSVPFSSCFLTLPL